MSNQGRFTQGPRTLRDRFNKSRSDLDSVLNHNLLGGGIAQVKRFTQGQSVTISRAALLRLISHSSGGGTGVRVAYVKTTPSSGNTVDVFLDTDDSANEETVTCTIYDDSGSGGTFADEVRPKLVDGTLFLVANIGGVWRNVTTLFSTETC